NRAPFAGDLYSVTCVGNVIGWVAGAGGSIVHTEDGGRTWAPQASHVSSSLRTIRVAGVAGAFLGVAAGDGGALLLSRDGATWSPVDLARGADASTWRAATIAIDSGV